jgi:acyl carrier protein
MSETPALADQVMTIIADTRRIPRETVTLESTFEGLAIDSFDAIEIVFQLEETFKIRVSDEDVKGIQNVQDVIAKLEALIEQGTATPVPAQA